MLDNNSNSLFEKYKFDMMNNGMNSNLSMPAQTGLFGLRKDQIDTGSMPSQENMVDYNKPVYGGHRPTNLTVNTGEDAASHGADSSQIQAVEKELADVMKKISQVQSLLNTPEAERMGDSKSNQIAKYRMAAQIASKYNVPDAKAWNQKADLLEFGNADGTGGKLTNAEFKMHRFEQQKADAELKRQAQTLINDARGMIMEGKDRNDPDVQAKLSEASQLYSQMVVSSDKERDLKLIKEEFGNVKHEFSEKQEDNNRYEQAFNTVRDSFKTFGKFIQSAPTQYNKLWNSFKGVITKDGKGVEHVQPAKAMAAYKMFIQSLDNSVVMPGEMGQGLDESLLQKGLGMLQSWGIKVEKDKNGEWTIGKTAGSVFTPDRMRQLFQAATDAANGVKETHADNSKIMEDLYTNKLGTYGITPNEAGMNSIRSFNQLGNVTIPGAEIMDGGAYAGGNAPNTSGKPGKITPPAGDPNSTKRDVPKIDVTKITDPSKLSDVPSIYQ